MISLISVLILSLSSFAGGDWVGNGGNVLTCQNQQGVSYQMLDLYEGHTRGFEADFGSASKTYDQKVIYVLNRLAKINPSRAQQYSQWYKDFFKETQFITDDKFVPIPDSGPLVIPKNCDIKQIAVQRPDDQILPGDFRYVIDLNLWNHLSTDSQASLILHEIIYREAITMGQVSSPKVRYFNEMIASKQIATLQSKELLALIRTVSFQSLDYFGYTVSLVRAKFFDTGELSCTLGAGGFFVSQNSQIDISNRVLCFHRNGQLKDIVIYGDDRLTVKVGQQFFNLANDYGFLSFYDNGAVSVVPASKPKPFVILGQAVQVVANGNSVRRSNAMFFYDDGTPLTLTLVTPLKVQKGNVTQEVLGRVRFHRDGTLIE